MKKKRRYHRDRLGRFTRKKVRREKKRQHKGTRRDIKRIRKAVLRRRIRVRIPALRSKRRRILIQRRRGRIAKGVRAVRLPTTVWLPISRWIRNLEAEYGEINWTRSDPPAHRLRLYNENHKFLWDRPRYPPLPDSVRYIIVECWYIVYDENEDAFYLWVQRRMLGAGWSFKEIRRSLAGIITDQEAKLEANSYIEIRAFVGWTVYPLAEWARVRLGRERKRKRK